MAKGKAPQILGGKRRRREAFIDLDRYYRDDKMFNAILYGNPRSGKSVLLANFVNMYQAMGFTVWINDVAKGFSIKTLKPRSEILMFFSEDLEYIKGVRIFVPENCEVLIPTQKYEQVTVTSYDDIFENLKNDRVNIICLESFIVNPIALSQFWALFAIELLIRAKAYELDLPMFGCLDQINNIFPSVGHGFGGSASKAQNTSSNFFAKFLRDSSGCGVKVAATSHQITAVKKNVRSSFQWKFFKNLSEDVGVAVPRIRPAQKIIETLPINQAYGCDEMSWGDVIEDIPNITYAPDPVYYKGKFIKHAKWHLASEHIEVLDLPSNGNAQGDGNAEAKKRLAGIKYCAGWSMQELADYFGVAIGTVHAWIEWLREDPDYSKVEKFTRPNQAARLRG